MAEPVILNGGDRMVTIKLPASFKKVTEKKGKKVVEKKGEFIVSRGRDTKPFKTIVITDDKTKIEVLIPIQARQWTIEVK